MRSCTFHQYLYQFYGLRWPTLLDFSSRNAPAFTKAAKVSIDRHLPRFGADVCHFLVPLAGFALEKTEPKRPCEAGSS